ncbi:hypothetical protein K501DRAFT_253588 [Backusella circina FSU 941]|nr:hypothetical protein K501DRAFT_253588 [Backusella circina FSU 941]
MQDINGHSLKNPQTQRELWILINDKIKLAEESKKKEDWDNVVVQFRKLREAVFSTMAGNGGNNLDFATKVFELSVTTCIKADNEEELFKCFNRLVEEIYVLYPETENQYFTALYVLYIKCRRRDHVYANSLMTRLNRENEFGKYAFDVLKCTKINRSNSFKYFDRVENAPTQEYWKIIHSYDNIIRIEALSIIREAYLSTTLAWIRKWLGLREDSDVVQEINRLQQGDCIKSFDQSRELVYFLKKRRVK